MSIRLMDSSVRDGGNVNDWNFGKRVIEGILGNLALAGVDVIELGYLKDVDFNADRTLYNSVQEAMQNLPEKSNENQKFSLMVQVDKWDWNKLTNGNGAVEIIRVSFHKTKVEEGMALAKLVMEHGYECHMNPINIMGYNDRELLELIDKINEVHPKTFTIVDTFGSMDIDDIKRIEALLHNNLQEDIEISAHLHENLGLAFSLALEFISFFKGKRDICIDSSVLGIGRVPGNLCQELVVDYLNKHYNTCYDIDYIYDTIDDFIQKIKEENPWGYAVPYALSATYNLHRTYPEWLVNQGRLRTKDIRYIISSIDEKERVIYNQKYIEKLYEEYLDVSIDDRKVISELKEIISGKNVCIVAPGSSISNNVEVVNKCIQENNCISIAVNFAPDFLDANFYFFTNFKRIQYGTSGCLYDKLIITSNLLKENINARYSVNFSRLKSFDTMTSRDSTLCLLNLLKQMDCKKIFVAGFDGFKGKYDHYDRFMDIDGDYKAHNDVVRSILSKRFKNMNIQFISESIYSDIFSKNELENRK